MASVFLLVLVATFLAAVRAEAEFLPGMSYHTSPLHGARF